MNNQLLTKIIKYNNKSCPDLVYDNPLLNRNIASELAKSFVKILTSSQLSTISNNNLRYCILENIRKLSQFQPEEHIKLNENAFEALIELYDKDFPRAANKTQDSCEHKLNEFLIRNLSDCEIVSDLSTTHRPELVQALINLHSGNNSAPDIIHWDCSRNQKWNTILKHIWDNFENCSELVLNDASLKMKPEIEKLILEGLYQLIMSNNDIVVNFEANEVFIDLAKKCSKSKECFRICINIFNHVFIATNFNSKLELFLPLFINYVKSNVADNKFPLLYPENLQCLAILMNINSEIFLNEDFKLKNETLNLLHSKEFHHKSDLVMLLSHYPQWIELYLEFKDSNTC